MTTLNKEMADFIAEILDGTVFYSEYSSPEDRFYAVELEYETIDTVEDAIEYIKKCLAQ